MSTWEDAESRLVSYATDIARNMAHDQVLTLAQAIRDSSEGGWSAITHRCLAVVPQLRFRDDVSRLIALWRTEAEHLPPEAVAFMLMGAAQATEIERDAQRLELIWTGPDSIDIPLRHTEQALLETIELARKRLLIVSFAVYLVPALSRAILAAAQRGAKIDICAESSTEDGGRIDRSPIESLGAEILDCARVFIWPRDKRPMIVPGKFASLHAKCAVADGRTLFVSSANLTGSAMAVNMELGVLIQGGAQPRQVEEHFQRLIDRSILQPLANPS